MDNNIKSNLNGNNNDVINLRELMLKYLKKWYWFVLAVIIAFILAFVYIKSTKIEYQIQTVILLRNDKSNSNHSTMAMMQSLGFNGVSKEVEDEIQVISSKKIIHQAIDSLNLQVEYYEKNGLRYDQKYRDMPFKLNLQKDFIQNLDYRIEIFVKESSGQYKVEVKAKNRFKEKYKLTNIQESFTTPAGIFKFSATALPKNGIKYKIVIHPINNLIESYGKKMNVTTVNKQSNVIKISIVESNVKKAEDFLNKIVELYNLDAIIDKNIIATNTANFIHDRLGIITQELFEVESDVENYKRSNQLTDLSSEAELYLQTASAYEKQLTELETKLNMIDAVENHIKNNRDPNALIPANVVTDDPSLSRSIQEYNLAVLDRMKLSQTANEKNPALIQSDQQISALKSNVLASVANVKSGIQIARNDVLRQGSQFSSKIKRVPTQERQFLEIKRQQEIKQNLYLFLSQKREETALSLATTAPAARTIDRAYASIDPVAPKKRIIYLVALILGLLVPFIYIYLKDLINNKIEDPKEFQKLVKAPYLGSIGTSREGVTVVVSEGKTTPIVEMFRLLRTNLKFLSKVKESPVILVTSSFSGEGKSFVSINLAMSLALMKRKVLVIGLDIRSPMLAKYLQIPQEKGVTIYLSDSSLTPQDIIVSSGYHPYLDVIPGGPVPPNPSELIMSPRLDELIKYAKENYDYVVLDTAPIGMVSDTYLLNRIADNAVYVARQNYTPRDAVALINEVYEDKRLNGMGVVLNGTSSTSSGYGYGYGYGAEKTRVYKLPKITFDEKIRDRYHRYLEKRRNK
ncbi:MAG: polysaccharide biosynthesis tyrosine autokinase [Porphyromonadaceae bacterium]|nr:polysaccharide biosynthesis tyrosine autokinase [Porphyromonadaceae bacterium]